MTEPILKFTDPVQEKRNLTLGLTVMAAFVVVAFAFGFVCGFATAAFVGVG